MMPLDFRITSIAIAVCCFLFSVGFFFFQTRELRRNGVVEWIAGQFLLGVYWVLLGLRGLIPDLFSILVANFCLSASYSSLYLAVRKFKRHPYRRDLLFLPAAATILFFLLFWVYTDNMFARSVYITFLSGIQTGFIASILLRDASLRVKRSQWITGCLFSLVAALWFIRFLELLATPGRKIIFPDTNQFWPVALILGCGIVILISIGVLLMIRDQSEETLRRSEENFRRSLDESPLGVRIVTEEGETIYANRAILDIGDFDSIEELNTTPLRKRYTPESYAEFQIRREKRRRGDPVPSEYEVSIVRKDGEARHLHVFRKEILWNGEKQFQAIYQDITERRRLEDALRENEERYRALFTRAAEGIFIISVNGELVEVNESFARMHGYCVQEMLNMKLKDFDTPESFQMYPDKIRRLLTGEALTFNVEHYHKDGHVFPLEVSASLISIGGESYIQCFHRDITERKRAEEELRISREQMRALAGRQQAVREEERTNMARAIHDELGGALTGLKIDFSLLTRAALKIENETVRTSLLAGMDSMIKSIDSTIQNVRRIAMELRPGVLDDLGLVAALEWQLKDFEKRTGIRCEFFSPMEEISLDTDLSTTLFRIFQEALTNVVRHSGATEVHVRMHADADSATLEVEDNGKGIKKEEAMSTKSLGLLGMRERAQMFGGRFTMTGTPGIGTKVTVEVSPVEKRGTDREEGGAAG
jgi:PAS domain S-box-containing protein